MPDEIQDKIFKADSGFVDRVVPSPNFGERRQNQSPDTIILHYTGMVSGEAALERLCDGDAEVSSHYLIFEDGETCQLVEEKHRAWHAGNSCWKGIRDINSHSVGIEIVNPGHEHGYSEFPDVQMNSVVQLVVDIVKRTGLDSKNVLAHSDIAPMRKQDPGELFDWKMLADAGIGNWIAPSPIQEGESLALGSEGEAVSSFQSALLQLGFELESDGRFDELTKACTIAFQRHFRPQKVDGIADTSTIDTLNRLLATS